MIDLHQTIGGIIYDLDGTLIESLTDLGITGNKMLAQFGRRPLPLSNYEQLVGHGIQNLCRQAWVLSDLYQRQEISIEDELSETLCAQIWTCAHRDVSTEQAANLTRTFQQIYAAQWREHTKPFPGITNLLDQMKRYRLNQAVCSNKAEQFVQDICAHCFPDLTVFSAIVGQTCEKPLKPDPKVALNIALQWQLDPRQILFVGDSEVDMQTALSAGMIPVAVTWGYRKREQLMAAGAAFVFNQVATLQAWLKRCVER